MTAAPLAAPTADPLAPVPTPAAAPETPEDDDLHSPSDPPMAPPDAPRRAAPQDSPPFTPEKPARYTQRLDGWTPARQRGFLERIAEGATIDEASASVGLSPGAAYSLRRRAAGGAFALGCDAAKLVARLIVAEAPFLRAIAGQVERVTKPDGEVIDRHRYDNRLAMSLLNRLDRHAEASETTNAAARLVAADFDAFLDLVARDAGPARAGLFLGERVGSDSDGPGSERNAAMAPILALACADRWLRTGAGLASEIDIADLDPAARAAWTAEQWARAEAAGLLRLAPEPKPRMAQTPTPQAPTLASALSILHSDQAAAAAAAADEDDGPDPVWYDDDTAGWHTSFPPPSPYFGTEDGNFGEVGYTRECSEQEAIILEAPRDREIAALIVTEGLDRDAWFVGYAIDGGLIEEAEAAAVGDTDAARVIVLAWNLDPLREDEDEDEEGDDGDDPGDPDGGDPASAPPPEPSGATPEPKSRTGRSPSVTQFHDGVSHEHFRQDQGRHLR